MSKLNQHGSKLKSSPSIRDMKSLLPGYDEASSYAYGYSRGGAVPYESGAMPEAGRSIKKLNIEKLPLQHSKLGQSAGELKKSRVGLNSRGKISEEYNLISKFDSTVFNPDTKLTQATVARLKTDLKPKTPSKPTVHKPKSPRENNYAKMKTKAFDGIESDLGFGFRPSAELNSSKSGKKTRLDFLENPEKAMQIAAKQTENSIQALKKKINKKSEQWSTEQFGWDGYHYQQPQLQSMNLTEENKKEPKYNGSPQANAKLAEMSRKFRHSLKVNTDMKRAIQTPKSNMTHVANMLFDASSLESMDGNENNTFQQAIDEAPFSSKASLTKSNKLHMSKKKNVKHVQIDASAKTNDGTPILSARKLKSKGRRKAHRKNDDSSDENGNVRPDDSAGVVPLRSLLESSQPGSYVSISKLDNESDEEGWGCWGNDTVTDDKSGGTTLQFQKLKKATSRLLAKSSANTSKTSVQVDTATSPRSSEPAVEIKIMPENFHSPSRKSSRSARDKLAEQTKAVPVENFIKQRLGESIKTVDDAAMIANRLGSLMARVALAKNSDTQTANKSAVDTVGLAKELRELATNIEKDSYASLNGKSFLASGSTQTQTEKDKNGKFYLQPKFTKQMSYTDQLVLRKLREIRKDWAKVGVDSFSQSSDLDK